MKKNISIFGIFVVLFLELTLHKAYAQQALCPGGYTQLCTFGQGGGVSGIVTGIIVIFILLTIFGSLFFLLLGGIYWILSGGDKGKIQKAQSTLIAAVIGLIISLSCYFLVNLILEFFLHQNITTFIIPRLVP